MDRFGIGPPGPVSVIDSEITTLTAFADKVLKVDGPVPYLLNLEPHAYHDIELTRTLWYRQVALDYKHGLPVLTVLILLRKQANSPGLTGGYERHLPDGSLANRYHFRVVRLWQEDPDPYLTGGVNLVPLAPLTKVKKAELRGLVRRMDRRINAEPEPRADKLWFAAYILMGWRYDEKLTTQLLKGVWNMHESPTYYPGKEVPRVGQALRLTSRACQAESLTDLLAAVIPSTAGHSEKPGPEKFLQNDFTRGLPRTSVEESPGFRRDPSP